jgi:hypothetical protein
VPPTPAQQAHAARLAAQIAETAQAGFILPGTPTERMTRCGYPGCRCHADPPALHGPLPPVDPQDKRQDRHPGPVHDQLADYQPWFDSQRRLRELIAELETLSQEIADSDPAGTARPPSPCGFSALDLQANLQPGPSAQVIPNVRT